MTGGAKLKSIVLAALMVLSVIAMGAGGFATTAVANGVQENPAYQLELTNNGNPHTIGIPGPLNGTIADMFVGGFDGVHSVYAYDGSGWTRVTNLDQTPDALEALVVTTSGEGPATIPLEVEFQTNISASAMSLSSGWNLVSATAFTDAQQSFGDGVNGSLLVLDRYDTPQSATGTFPSVGAFENYVIGSTDWTGNPAPDVSAFKGYFVYLQGPSTITPAVSNVANKNESNIALGLGAITYPAYFDVSITGDSVTEGENASVVGTVTNDRRPGWNAKRDSGHRGHGTNSYPADHPGFRGKRYDFARLDHRLLVMQATTRQPSPATTQRRPLRWTSLQMHHRSLRSTFPSTTRRSTKAIRLLVTVTANYDNGSQFDVTGDATISSDNSTVATVANGTITAQNIGSANITADYQGFSDSATVTVTAATVTGVNVALDNATIADGGTTQATVTADFSDNTVVRCYERCKLLE
ncbi:MAG: surface glycoprotein [Natrialbaceae archaeon]|nr:surface glycoprotein [Natrialbaceae archaeon]